MKNVSNLQPSLLPIEHLPDQTRLFNVCGPDGAILIQCVTKMVCNGDPLLKVSKCTGKFLFIKLILLLLFV